MSKLPHKWQDAALSVVEHWENFSNARNPVEAATAVVELSNAVFSLATLLPFFDQEQGRVDWDRLNDALARHE